MLDREEIRKKNNEKQKRYREKNIEICRQRANEWYHKHKNDPKLLNKRKEYDRERYYRDVEKTRKRARDYYHKNKVKKGEYNRILALRRKITALQKINPELECEVCGMDDIRVLQINHIDGIKVSRDGGKNTINSILTDKEDTSELNLLCANCNWIWEHEQRKRIWDILPHEPLTKHNMNWIFNSKS